MSPIDLDSIPWATLTHAYGPAEDTPKHLAALLSPKERVRNKAWEELYPSILHQGSVYTATAEAARVMISYLATGRSPAPEELLMFLRELCHSVDRDGVPEDCCSDPAATPSIRRLIDETRNFFRALLDKPDELSRETGLAALNLSNDPPFLAAALLPHFDRETNPHFRAVTLYRLHRVRDQIPGWSTRLEALLEDPSPMVRFAAACGIAQILGPNAPANTEAALHAGALSSTDEPNDWIASLRGNLDLYIEAAERLGERRLAESLLQTVRLATQDEESVRIAHRLLRLVFEDYREWTGGVSFSFDPVGGKMRSPGLGSMLFRALWMLFKLKLGIKPKLAAPGDGTRRIDVWGAKGLAPGMPATCNANQSRAIRAIAESDTLWSIHTNLWSLYKLPEDREAFRARAS